jgi:hypothetical protein
VRFQHICIDEKVAGIFTKPLSGTILAGMQMFPWGSVDDCNIVSITTHPPGLNFTKQEILPFTSNLLVAMLVFNLMKKLLIIKMFFLINHNIINLMF